MAIPRPPMLVRCDQCRSDRYRHIPQRINGKDWVMKYNCIQCFAEYYEYACKGCIIHVVLPKQLFNYECLYCSECVTIQKGDGPL